MAGHRNSVKRSETFPRTSKWEADSDEEKNNPPADTSEVNAHHDDEETRSKSSVDVRSADDSPRISRRKKIWNSFKRFRSRSRDKRRRSGAREDPGRGSEGDVSQGSVEQGRAPLASQDFDALFDVAEQRDNDGCYTPMKSIDTPMKNDLNANVKGSGRLRKSLHCSSSFSERYEKGRQESKDSEADSGLGENTVETGRISEGTVHQRRTVTTASSNLRDHPFFQLDIVLKEGRDLMAMDSCGTSDPYVKFKVGSKQVFKTRIIYKTLNPEWNEKCAIPLEDPFKPVRLQVFDYDRGISDDSMGVADIDPSTLDLNVPTELKLNLSSEKRSKKKSLGYLLLQCTLLPKTQEDKEQYFKRSMKENQKKVKTQMWSSVVTIVLVEGKDLLAMDDNGFSDPYVKFKLGTEKYKSKYKPKTLNPTWIEQFDLYMYDDQTSHLEMSVWDHDTGGKDDIMGRATIDLSDLLMEKTHTIVQQLEDGSGSITFLLTISGCVGTECISDLANYTPNPKEREDLVRKYSLVHTPKSMKNIGWLQVKAIKAEGLAAADLGGKSDPFCVLELVNSRVQTHTEYKTLFPEWGKIFTFDVKDIHSILEVTVYDEDRDKKVEFLGKIAIPLLKIKSGERKWFALKDKKLMKRAKGAIQLEMEVLFNDIHKGERRWYALKDKNSAGRKKGSVLLEMDYEYNPIRAAVRTINPAETKYMKPDPKFKISLMKRNIDRVTKLAEAGVESGKFIGSCFQWESKIRSITAMIVYILMVWNFELYMVPLSLLIVFMKNLLVVQIVGNLMKDKEDSEYVEEDDDDEEEEKEKSDTMVKPEEEKKSFKEKLQAIQEVCLQVQEGMDMAASMGERIKNTFNWTVPWLSWLAVTGLTIGTLVLYFVPLRILLLLWGINKFTKRLRKGPNFVDNNELLDFLSRVPSDKELVMYRELRPEPNVGNTKKKRN